MRRALVAVVSYTPTFANRERERDSGRRFQSMILLVAVQAPRAAAAMASTPRVVAAGSMTDSFGSLLAGPSVVAPPFIGWLRLAAVPIANIERDAPIEQIDPTDPMDRIDPAEPMENSDPADPSERAEPVDSADAIDSTEPAE
jgi:hypothetical protein